ncbi:MAG: hypothetical protein O3A20_07430 [Planctomycetota bacterium]|nr:hypothetical protein [Planctomycetota bacterium]
MLTRSLLPLLAVGAALLLAPDASAQRGKQEACWVCKEDPELMAAAGIVNHGPFVFFNSDSQEIQDHLGARTILWIESTHFRIGSDLKDWKIPVDQKKLYRAELEELSKKFPAIDPKKTATLDRPLRLHLFAERMEKMYSEVVALSQTAAAQWENLPPEETFLAAKEGEWETFLNEDYQTRPPRPQGWASWIELGRFFGMPMKFEILMFHYKADMERFKRDYIGHEDSHPQRWHCTWKVDVGQPKSRAMWFGFSSDAEGMKHDQHVHNALLHNVGINMLDAYMCYLVESPFWLRIGLGHWLTQRNSPDYNFYDLDEGAGEMNADESNYAVAVRKLVVSNSAPTFLDLAKLSSFGEMGLHDHIVSWSKVHFLIETNPDGYARFLLAIKFNPTNSANLDVQREALQSAFGWSFLSAEDAWKTWVLETYPVK